MHIPAFVFVSMLGCGLSAFAADAERGGLLYKNHCEKCHTTHAHARDSRKVQNHEELDIMIRRWVAYLELDWGPGEIDDVHTYLNDRFYNLEQPQ